MWNVAENTPTKEAIELKEIREKLKMKQREMADALGLDFDKYRNYEYRKPPRELLERARSMIGMMRELSPLPLGQIERLGAIGAGGAPSYEGDQEAMYVPISFARDYYKGVPVEAGQYSMLPFIHPGDTLIFKNGTMMGKFVAVRIEGETLPICKKLTIADGRPVFRSTNPDFADIPTEGHMILGYLVGIVPADYRLCVGPDESGIDENYMLSLLGSRLP